MKKDFVAPEFQKRSFTCPFCGVRSEQIWFNLDISSGSEYFRNHIKACVCHSCEKYSIWKDEQMIFPKESNVPMPNEDLPENVTDLYNQARNIFNDSPRGACALLRLAVEELCVSLKETGNDLNSDIANLVKKGLPKGVQQALDTVRIIGNNAVHPGQIVIEDNLETASSLFSLINFIAEKMITETKQLKELYSSLPSSSLQQIEKRDGTNG